MTQEKTSPGLFIAVEGADGSGKTTLHAYIVQRFRDALLSFGREVVPTRELGGSPVAEKLRDLITGADPVTKIDPTHKGTRLLMVLASRMQHIASVIYPAVLAGKVVISDRCFDSTHVYQGMKDNQEDALSVIENLPELSVLGNRPNYTFFLDVTPEVSWERTAEDRNKGETMNEGSLQERAEDIQRYRQRMGKASVTHPGTIIRIDATKSIEEVKADLDPFIQGICSMLIVNSLSADEPAGEKAEPQAA